MRDAGSYNRTSDICRMCSYVFVEKIFAACLCRYSLMVDCARRLGQRILPDLHDEWAVCTLNLSNLLMMCVDLSQGICCRPLSLVVAHENLAIQYDVQVLYLLVVSKITFHSLRTGFDHKCEESAFTRCACWSRCRQRERAGGDLHTEFLSPFPLPVDAWRRTQSSGLRDRVNRVV